MAKYLKAQLLIYSLAILIISSAVLWGGGGSPCDPWDLDKFSNGNAIENLTFSQPGSIVRYFTIPNSSEVVNASLTLSSYVIDVLEYCYQETANASHASDGDCTLVNTGSYASTDSGTGYVYMNYT